MLNGNNKPSYDNFADLINFFALFIIARRMLCVCVCSSRVNLMKTRVFYLLKTKKMFINYLFSKYIYNENNILFVLASV